MLKILWDLEIRTDHLILIKRPDLMIVHTKKRTCRIVDFAVPDDHRVKLKESKKRDKYHDFAKELNKIWNMKMTEVPTVKCAFSTVTEELIQRVEDFEKRGRM